MRREPAVVSNTQSMGRARKVLVAVLAWGPAVVVIAWFAAGQWAMAGREPRAWLVFTSILCAASVVPLPGRRPSRAATVSSLQLWAWTALGGLVVLT